MRAAGRSGKEGPPARVLGALGVAADTVTELSDVPGANGSWLAGTAEGERLVLRRYHAGATAAGLAYEHAVLRHLAAAGWAVPEPVSELVEEQGLWYCLTRFVPGAPVAEEDPGQQRQRGGDLARLHRALRGLGGLIGQRPGWRAQHQGLTVHTGLDWAECLRGLREASPRLGARAEAAAAGSRAELAAIGADELPVLVVHGDFAEWNVHYQRGRLAGVIDFGLTHLDSRPYELAIARGHRAPGLIAGYRAEAARGGWPLTELEEAAIGPVYRAFRVSMAAGQMSQGLRDGRYDLARIEHQLVRAALPPA
ncbi:MAG: phosphotransferase enzyme family protein [Streptosporangiaceae bacterium]